MNIIRISKNLFIIDGVLLKLKLDADSSCERCYYDDLSCDTDTGYVLCAHLKINENYESSDDMHYLQPVQLTKSLILSSKIRYEYNKNK